jgi:hypothetical protein
MKTINTDIIMHNKVFVAIAVATGLLLLLPFFAMQFGWQIPDPGSTTPGGANWTTSDFVVMGTLIFGTSSMFVLAARKVNKKNRLALGIAFAIAFLWLWAELAVGIFTNWGS